MPIKSLSQSSLLNFQKYSSMLAGNDPFSPSAYDLLETQVLASSAASVSFTGLDTLAAGYQHLQIRMVTQTAASGGYNATVRLNGDTGSNYAGHQLVGLSGTMYSFSQVSTSSPTFRTSEDYPNPNIIDILDFSNTSKNTTIREFTGSGTTIWLRSILWNNTSAVTSISMTPTGDFITGSRFSIYGTKAA